MNTPMRRSLPAIACAAMLISACHMTPAQDDARHAQGRFMDLWLTYSHCRTTDDLRELLSDASRLNRGAAAPQRPVPSLLKPVKAYISPPAVRVAADPRDMAQACSLKAADAALAAGWTEVAIALYKSLIPVDGDESPSNYYARQAETGLAAALMKQDHAEGERSRLQVHHDVTDRQENRDRMP
jgi:hypothetical protein